MHRSPLRKKYLPAAIAACTLAACGGVSEPDDEDNLPVREAVAVNSVDVGASKLTFYRLGGEGEHAVYALGLVAPIGSEDPVEHLERQEGKLTLLETFKAFAPADAVPDKGLVAFHKRQVVALKRSSDEVRSAKLALQDGAEKIFVPPQPTFATGGLCNVGLVHSTLKSSTPSFVAESSSRLHARTMSVCAGRPKAYATTRDPVSVSNVCSTAISSTATSTTLLLGMCVSSGKAFFRVGYGSTGKDSYTFQVHDPQVTLTTGQAAIMRVPFDSSQTSHRGASIGTGHNVNYSGQTFVNATAVVQ